MRSSLIYNLRWFLPEKKGHEYNRVLETEFGVKPTNAWTGWVTTNSFEKINDAIDRIYDKTRTQFFRPRAPLFSIMPTMLSRAQAKSFYQDYDEVFGITSCIMPSAWLRVHSTGELIYCPGHPDLIPGNVFTGDIREIYLNEMSTKLRKRVEKELLPICNRCCGLYMTHHATRRLGKGFMPEKRSV